MWKSATIDLIWYPKCTNINLLHLKIFILVSFIFSMFFNSFIVQILRHLTLREGWTIFKQTDWWTKRLVDVRITNRQTWMDIPTGHPTNKTPTLTHAKTHLKTVFVVKLRQHAYTMICHLPILWGSTTFELFSTTSKISMKYSKNSLSAKKHLKLAIWNMLNTLPKTAFSQGLTKNYFFMNNPLLDKPIKIIDLEIPPETI